MKRALLLACAFGLVAAGADHPASASPSATVEGFGNDVPLAMAVRQIAPPGSTVVYGNGINRNVRVNWQGGADWQSVLRSMNAHGKHLAVDVSGSTVTISDADAAYAGPVPYASMSPAPAAVQRPAPYAAQPYSTSQRGLVVIPYHQPEAPAPMPEPVAAAPAPAPAPAPLPAPVPAPAPAPVQEAAKPALAPAADAPKAEMAAKDTETAKVDLPSASADAPVRPMTARERRAAAAAARAEQRQAAIAARADAHVNPAAGSLPVHVTQPVVSADGHMWHARQGSTLDQVLGDWADKAGWTLVFSSPMIYELQASADFEGDFLEAAGSLVRSVRAAPQPVATFYRGNKTVVVSNHADSAN